MTGIVKSNVQPNNLSWNVWVNGEIVRFCVSISEAGKALNEELSKRV